MNFFIAVDIVLLLIIVKYFRDMHVSAKFIRESKLAKMRNIQNQKDN